MEGLNNMVKIDKHNGWIKGFQVAMNGHNRQEITHFPYADETLIFCDAEVRIILVLFEGISRLHINWKKSPLLQINEVTNMEALTMILGKKWGHFLHLYWQAIGAKSKSIAIWNNVQEKYKKKLSRWKCQYLSLGGRLTLKNSILDSLPTYMISLSPSLWESPKDLTT